MQNLEQTPLDSHKVSEVSQHTPLILGCDRRCLILGEMVLFMAGYVNNNKVFILILVGIMMYLLLIFLRKLGNVDPYLIDIWIRGHTYKSFYAAKSSPLCESTHRYKGF